MSGESALTTSFIERYRHENRVYLAWMLGRLERARTGPFLDTKLDAIALRDYTDADGLRGPRWTYGWIQGRGLEALATHAAFFEGEDRAFAARLDAAAIALYDALETLVPDDGCAAFCYGPNFTPVSVASEPEGAVQLREQGIRTYTDAFVVKGRIAAAARYRPENLPRHLAVLDDIVAAIDEGRFLRDESGDITARALGVQGEDYAPHMILLGAAALLHRVGCGARDTFATRFVEHVETRHVDARSGLLAGAPGGSSCNVGHAIEFTGFAFEALDGRMPGALAERLADLVTRHVEVGFEGPGLRLTVDVPGGHATSELRPWWCLPETIRAAALAYATTGRSSMLEIWRRADAAFFEHFRRPGDAVPVAFQTRDADGPRDHVPATPDLDPAYHTGLSLLGAIESSGRVRPPPDGSSRSHDG